jgi:hypothetical protein
MSCESNVDRTLQLISRQAACIALIGLVCITIGCNSSQSGGGVAPPTSTTTTLPPYHGSAEGDVPITITGGSFDLDLDPHIYKETLPGSGVYISPDNMNLQLAGLIICNDNLDKGCGSEFPLSNQSVITATSSKSSNPDATVTIKQVLIPANPPAIPASFSQINITLAPPLSLDKRHPKHLGRYYSAGRGIKTLTVSDGTTTTTPSDFNKCSSGKCSTIIIIK